MGTRSNTVVLDGNEVKLINLYRQFDGYPQGHGKELAAFLTDLTLVNGLGSGDKRRTANGMGCLAAQLVANFKTESGGFYLHNPNEDLDNDYTYLVYGDTYQPSAGLRVVVMGYGTVKFNGSVPAFAAFCESDK